MSSQFSVSCLHGTVSPYHLPESRTKAPVDKTPIEKQESVHGKARDVSLLNVSLIMSHIYRFMGRHFDLPFSFVVNASARKCKITRSDKQCVPRVASCEIN